LQHHIGSRLRQYLLLIRLPNAFTAPSNVLAGYFATTLPAEASGINLISLMVSSGLLYIAGIAFNDYFDIEIDRKERPSRPLPSGSVPKKHAVAIALVAMIAANAITLVAVGLASFAVSLILSAMIIAYDYRLKRTVAGPLAMGGSRFLNVILGASPAILFLGAGVQFELTAFAGASMFLYVVAITLLSKKEVGIEKPSLIPFSVVFAVIAAIAAIGLNTLRLEFLVSLSILTVVMVVTFKRHIMTDPPSVQKAIRNMVISIIILDSVFVSGTAGLSYGLATMLFIAPAVVLAKKLYVT
jgi:4-hydroxybenzoate polyprenyltransferase